jgi:hypothetical protein
MKRTLLLVLVLFLLFAAEILKVYFIMPFPGSQRSETINIAYFLHRYIWWLRIAGWIALLALIIYAYPHARTWKKVLLSIFLILYALVFYAFNFKFLAEKMFLQPEQKIMASVMENKVADAKLVVGISINGQARAYPIEIIAYHHQVIDTIGGEVVMVTYCSVCRTGRVFSPVLNGKQQQFRLVGMDHFNAMFEDAETKSWWRQSTGEAITGPMKGQRLKELPSTQMRLSAWIRQYPNTLILQPDPAFIKRYADLEGFDEGTIKSGLEKRDTGSWQFKSWVVGVSVNGAAKAYDWNGLLKQRIIQDEVAGKPILLVMENDNASFHVWSRELSGQPLQFSFDDITQLLKDNNGSTWNMDGLCLDGNLKGSRLSVVPAYQEFWHSWQSFHPGTGVYK